MRWLLLVLSGCSRTTLTPTELCNGADDDGDGEVDEGLRASWYLDADADGVGAGYAVESCRRGFRWVAVDGDCDDTDPARSPDRLERCNGVDDDCDGSTDEGLLLLWYPDADGDGWGDASAPIEACEVPDGATERDGDCDDADPSSYVGGTETCDGRDQDCDGRVDEGALATFHADADGDGYGDPTSAVEACSAPDGSTRDATDCADDEPTANPAGIERCNTWIDEDCDGGAGECAMTGALPLSGADRTVAVSGTSARGLAAGDIDADGLPDLVVGDPAWRLDSAVGDEFTYIEGAVSVLYGVEGRGVRPYGLAPLTQVADLTLASDLVDLPTDLGESVQVADLDGDGLADLVAGAPEWDPGGRVLVAPGVAGAWTSALRGEDEAAAVGASIAVGDLDGDGISDLLVGGGRSDVGVFVVPGPITVSGAIDDLATAGWWADVPLTGACDVDGDGAADALIRTGGTLYVSLAPHSGTGRAESIGIALTGATGAGEAACGDLDGDGHLDLLVGAPGADTAGENAGAVFVASGPISASADLTTGLHVDGLTTGDALGTAVAWVGDVDGDDTADVALGAPGLDTTENDAGGVYLLGAFSGSEDLSGAVVFTGAGDEGVGTRVVGVGDSNADGYDDMAIAGGAWGVSVTLIFGRGI